jgi:hypothetical protein
VPCRGGEVASTFGPSVRTELGGVRRAGLLASIDPRAGQHDALRDVTKNVLSDVSMDRVPKRSSRELPSRRLGPTPQEGKTALYPWQQLNPRQRQDGRGNGADLPPSEDAVGTGTLHRHSPNAGTEPGAVPACPPDEPGTRDASRPFHSGSAGVLHPVGVSAHAVLVPVSGCSGPRHVPSPPSPPLHGPGGEGVCNVVIRPAMRP